MGKYVKFIGKLTDLIPDGWTFQKLMGRNYRQYHKTADGEKYGRHCRIWQHFGGYLEIDDLGDLSYQIVEMVASGMKNIPYRKAAVIRPGYTRYPLMVDMQNNVIVPKDYNIHNQFRIPEGEEEAFFNRWREYTLGEDMVKMIQDLLSKKWIEVREDNRTPKKKSSATTVKAV